MNNVSAIVYHEHGDPATVVRLERQELPDVKADEVRIRMLAAPINPADLNVIEGKYPVRGPPMPAVPGMEGAGVVEAAGREVTHLNVGDLVMAPHGTGTWREAFVSPAHGLVAAPEIAPEQAAMLKVNPATAWRMLHDFVELKAGDWVIQNAANSGVGRAVIQIAKQLGIRTVNLVRRAELIKELEAEGADVVLTDGQDIRKLVPELTGKVKIMLALNAVGGESALHVANALAPHGMHVTYGAMSLHPVRVPNGLLIFKDLRFRGFWITKWYQESAMAAKQEMFKHLFSFAQRGILKMKVEKFYPLADAREAILRARQGGRDGKIVFRIR